MTEQLRAFDVLSEENKNSYLFLTKKQFERKYRNARIVYFLETAEPKNLIDRQQAVLQLAKETGGWVFSGIHKETDWSETHFWSAGWHLCNRTGEYAVVIETK